MHFQRTVLYQYVLFVTECYECLHINRWWIFKAVYRLEIT